MMPAPHCPRALIIRVRVFVSVLCPPGASAVSPLASGLMRAAPGILGVVADSRICVWLVHVPSSAHCVIESSSIVSPHPPAVRRLLSDERVR